MSLFHQSHGYTFKYPSLKLQTMASYHFTGGKHYDRNVCGTTDATPPNSAETRPPGLFSMHKHTERSSRRAQTHPDQIPSYHNQSTATAPAGPSRHSL